MASKIIPIIEGYSIQFDQRARGEETPYWQGTIYKDGARVGSFSNNGRGGSTIVHPFTLATELGQVVTAAAQKKGYKKELFEPENEIFVFAEILGYNKDFKKVSPAEAWDIYIQELVGS